VPGCALAIEEIFDDAGLPANLFRTVLIGSEDVGALIDDEHIAAVTLTGSEAAGRAVASRAGRSLKKTVLELGGSDPYVVLEDANLDVAVKACTTGRLINSGQSCIAAKRFIVVDELREEFERRVVEAMSSTVVGDPLAAETEVGPLARADLREELDDQVRRSISSGAKCLLGGTIPDGPGWFYPVTVLTDVRPGMAAHDEELFGPVAAIVPVKDATEAIEVANSSSYGLGAAVFTTDVQRGERIAVEELEAGCCFVNDFVRSDPRLPFGGIKTSGYGRELAGEGIREFVNVKTVWVA
jgi:succinate-semialdehyde dehydrogenase/glutarate-semialdehyde dehydrogenase